MSRKYILVTGGVISGVGKGVIASSLGAILKCCGIEVTAIKIDPYINLDAGTFSPYEHGKLTTNYYLVTQLGILVDFCFALFIRIHRDECRHVAVYWQFSFYFIYLVPNKMHLLFSKQLY